MTLLQTDYLAVGAGAMAMAFDHTLLIESPLSRVLMADRRGHVGGHRNDAYSFVRPHHPAPWPQFEAVMRDRLLPRGRVLCCPKTEYLGGERGVHRLRSLVSGDMSQIRRCVASESTQPTRAPKNQPSQATRLKVAAGVRCVASNELARLERPTRTARLSVAARPGWLSASVCWTTTLSELLKGIPEQDRTASTLARLSGSPRLTFHRRLQE